MTCPASSRICARPPSLCHQGGGIGYDFSTLRPKARRSMRGSDASGPLSFMDVVGRDVGRTSWRRLSPRRDDGNDALRHPDIEAFIEAKH